MPKQSNSDESDERYDYAKLLKRREWREKKNEIIAKSPRCQKCGRTGRRFAVHHSYYDYGRLPWDYPDEAYMVVCNGRCHREADEDREEQQRDAENYDRFVWQWELGKKEQPPREKEFRRLATYESEFKAWLVRTILPGPWDWDNKTYPLWWFWNQFSNKFLAERQDDDRQGRLAL
ncbi:MAG TPA: hypothetical protein DCK99_05120 [Blastocatellia bacterium]|nr:hypothetical protein [Blastocatellia bacterium]